MVAMLLGLIGSLVQARYVAPEDMGVFRSFGIIAGYLTFLGTLASSTVCSERSLSNWVAETRPRLTGLPPRAWFRIVFISTLCGAVFLALCVKAAWRDHWMRLCGWLGYLPVIAGTFYGGYLGTTFRTGQQFVRFSNANVLQAVAGTLLLPLLPSGLLWGLLATGSGIGH